MGFQLWLPQVLRGAGLTVVEVAGWKTRSAEEDRDASTYNPGGVIIHETRGSANSTDAGEIGVLVNGRVGLSGPIAQCYIGRDGRWHVVAAGLCHHVKTGWGGPFAGLGNTRLLGIEPAHSVDEDWANKPAQYEAYVRGVAAIIKHKGWPPPVGHKEHQPGDKPDPEFNMDRFRADVAAVAAGGDEMTKEEMIEAVVLGIHRAMVEAGKPAEGPAGSRGRQIRDNLRLAIGSTVDVDEAALAAALAPMLPGGVTVEQVRALLNSARLTTD